MTEQTVKQWTTASWLSLLLPFVLVACSNDSRSMWAIDYAPPAPFAIDAGSAANTATTQSSDRPNGQSGQSGQSGQIGQSGQSGDRAASLPLAAKAKPFSQSASTEENTAINNLDGESASIAPADLATATRGITLAELNQEAGAKQSLPASTAAPAEVVVAPQSSVRNGEALLQGTTGKVVDSAQTGASYDQLAKQPDNGGAAQRASNQPDNQLHNQPHRPGDNNNAVANKESGNSGEASNNFDKPIAAGISAVNQGGGITSPIYTAQTGDTIYQLSRRYGFAVQDMVDLNELGDDPLLIAGNSYFLPIPSHHQVQEGQTLTEIARMHQVSVELLMRKNSITDTEAELYPGEELQIPGVSFTASAQAATQQRGAVTVAATTDAISGGENDALETSETSALLAQPENSNNEAALTAGVKRNLAAIPNSILPNPPPRSSSKFLMPANGELAFKFKQEVEGHRQDGIGIRVPLGTAVKAAENGVVIFSDISIRALGKLLLLQHQDGYYTAYAYNDELLVSRGDLVKRGQTIARSGNSGPSGQELLMFQVRHNRNAIDPLDVIAR